MFYIQGQVSKKHANGFLGFRGMVRSGGLNNSDKNGQVSRLAYISHLAKVVPAWKKERQKPPPYLPACSYQVRGYSRGTNYHIGKIVYRFWLADSLLFNSERAENSADDSPHICASFIPTNSATDAYGSGVTPNPALRSPPARLIMGFKVFWHYARSFLIKLSIIIPGVPTGYHPFM